MKMLQKRPGSRLYWSRLQENIPFQHELTLSPHARYYGHYALKRRVMTECQRRRWTTAVKSSEGRDRWPGLFGGGQTLPLRDPVLDRHARS